MVLPVFKNARGGQMKKNTGNFKKGSMEMLVLHLLKSGDKYGFELTQLIDKYSGGIIEITLGSLYPLLYKLEEKGYVTEREELVGKRLKRIYYHLEENGEQYLGELINDYNETHRGIRNILEVY
jgi:PadR family transcriptional regulator PadR